MSRGREKQDGASESPSPEDGPRRARAPGSPRDALDDEVQRADPRAAGPIPDLIRRTAALGLASFFSTEEALRKALGDTLPRDWIDFATAQSERTRSEATQRMAEEMGRVLEQMDVVDVLEKLLSGRTIEIEARVRLGPRDDEESSSDAGGRASIRVVGPESEEP